MNNRIPYDLICIFYTLGCLPLLFLTSLPATKDWYIGLIVLGLICFIYYRFRKLILIPIIFLMFGFLWSTNCANKYLTLVEQYIDQKIIIRAEVMSLNISNTSKKLSPKINFSITHINQIPLKSNLSIVLLWPDLALPSAGQIWDLRIKTKVVHSYLNEGGFDSQRYAISNRLLLTGSIEKAQLVAKDMSLRQVIVNSVLPYINLFEYGDVMLALAFGERSSLVSQHKQVMFETGIAHLMAISGMHIVLVSLLTNHIIHGLQFFLPNRFIKYGHRLIAGWVMAIFYAWLTGFNPPTLRAILALTLWLLFRHKHYHITAWQMINRIIAILLFYDPFMILSESFWLSCYAVVCLIFIAHWFPYQGISIKHQYLKQLLRLQVILTLLLLPIQLVIFNGLSGTSLIANLFAIPIITIIVFPLVLVMLFLSLVGNFYLTIWCGLIAEQTLSLLFVLLKFITGWWINIAQAYFFLSFSGWFFLIAYRCGFWRNYFISCLIILMLLISPLFKYNQVWRIDMLDVGHGLAIVIRHGKSAILYDTGPKWQDSSAAERIIIPFLKWHDLTIEGIIISHEHNDHIGGLNIIQQHYPKAWLISSTQRSNNNLQCIAGREMIWKELKFSFLWPIKAHNQALNDGSCVVQISNSTFSMLLTGDLEHKQEEQLVSIYRKQLFSTILQIPHHASNTSSFYAFLSQVKPNISLGSVARYNPWKLPSYKALKRYHDLGLSYFLTSFTGQISIFINHDNWYTQTYRNEIKPRWYHDWFGGFIN